MRIAVIVIIVSSKQVIVIIRAVSNVKHLDCRMDTNQRNYIRKYQYKTHVIFTAQSGDDFQINGNFMLPR